jgi:DNA-binding winged helix-turn-helix (wHTH) protein
MSPRSYRFGEYRVDPALREVWCRERLIALPPHVFDCLAYLLERHDRAVSRDELVAAVWGKTEVSDTLLGQTVLRIRRTLGDDAKDPQILRTIPRFGYRWVAPLTVVERDGSSHAPGAYAVEVAAAAVAVSAEHTDADTSAHFESGTSSTPASPPLAVSSARRVAWIVGAALVAAVALSGWYFRGATRARVAMNEAPISAVVPAAIEPGGDSAWMRLGVMDVVAGRLRSAGVPSVPSENVVAWLNAPAAQRSGTLREALAAPLIVTPRVRRTAASWQVDLDADDDAGQHYVVQASAGDATVAAREAADKLLVALGRSAVASQSEGAPEALLLRRIDAAVLADDPDTAHALIAAASPSEQQSAEVRLRLAKIDFRGGRLAAARTRLVALLDEVAPRNDPLLRASVLNGLGAVAIREDHPAQAEKHFAEAVALLEPLTSPAELGKAYLGRAAAAADQRHFDAAAADYARARIAFRQANDTLALIRVAANEGFVDLERGQPAQALPQLVAATEGFQRWGALNEAIMTSIGQIGCHLALLDGRSAIAVADAAEGLAQRIENASTRESLALARARALAAVGRLREARDVLDRLRSTSADPVLVGAAGGVLARLELDRRNAGIAADLAERAVAQLDVPNMAVLRADTWLTEVRATLLSADAARAANVASALEGWAGQTDLRRALLFSRLARAEYGHRFGDGKDWRAAFDTVRDLAGQGASPYELAMVAESYAEALLAEGDVAAAAVEVGRLSRWSEQDFRCAVLEARLYAAMGRDEARQTALARARALAGERAIPDDALTPAIGTNAASR